MKPTITGRCASSLSSIPFQVVRNISSPEDLQEGRIVYAGQMPISSIVNIATDENVRGYLVEAEGKQRRSPTQVHMAIRETLREKSYDFSVLNSGVVIVASSCEIDEKTRCLKLVKSSIINGSQTQGEIKAFLENGGNGDKVHIKFELIVTGDDDLIADISIARNFQNDVQLLSIAGRKGELDELAKALTKSHPTLRLSKSETQRPNEDNDLISTEKLLQVLAALLPAKLWWKSGEMAKAYSYSAKATCLKDFRHIYEEVKGDEPPTLRDVYRYYLDMAGAAWTLYVKWKSHPAFKGTGLRSIERDGAEIVEVPDGIVFPIIASLSCFVEKTPTGWHLNQPELLNDKELVASAKIAYQEIAKSNPGAMGKSKACYSSIAQVTDVYRRLLAK